MSGEGRDMKDTVMACYCKMIIQDLPSKLPVFRPSVVLRESGLMFIKRIQLDSVNGSSWVTLCCVHYHFLFLSPLNTMHSAWIFAVVFLNIACSIKARGRKFCEQVKQLNLILLVLIYVTGNCIFYIYIIDPASLKGQIGHGLFRDSEIMVQAFHLF